MNNQARAEQWAENSPALDNDDFQTIVQEVARLMDETEQRCLEQAAALCEQVASPVVTIPIEPTPEIIKAIKRRLPAAFLHEWVTNIYAAVVQVARGER